MEKLIRINDLQKFFGKSRSYVMNLLYDMKQSGNDNVIFNPTLKIYGVLNFNQFINNIKEFERCKTKTFTKEEKHTTLTSQSMVAVTGNQLENILYGKQ